MTATSQAALAAASEQAHSADAPKRGRSAANRPPKTALYGDTKTAAALIGIGKSTLEKTRLDGSGPPFVKIGRLVRYHLPTCLEWAAARSHQSTSEYVRPAA
jgi:hypothetical protein